MTVIFDLYYFSGIAFFHISLMTEGTALISVEIKYKNQVFDNIGENQLIVDNSNFVLKKV